MPTYGIILDIASDATLAPTAHAISPPSLSSHLGYLSASGFSDFVVAPGLMTELNLECMREWLTRCFVV